MRSLEDHTVDHLPCLEGQKVTEIARARNGEHALIVARVERPPHGVTVIRVAKWIPGHDGNSGRGAWRWIDGVGSMWTFVLPALEAEAKRQAGVQR